ncbi:hypothetical protein IJT93_09520 [bacterium]|nr:hypothetical protein [bacterium]
MQERPFKGFIYRHWHFLLLLAAALLVRCAAAVSTDVFIDEALTFFKSENGIVPIFTHDTDEPMLPFWYIFLHIWRQLFPAGVFCMRLPAVLSGTAAVGLTYLSAFKIFKDKSFEARRAWGFLAALLPAFLYGCVLSDAQMRCYGFLSLCIAGLIFFGLDFINNEAKKSSYCGLLCFGFFGCLAHYIGCAAVLGLLGCIFFLTKEKITKLWGGLSLLPGLAVSGGYFIYNFLTSSTNFAHNRNSGFNNFFSIFWAPGEYMGLDAVSERLFDFAGLSGLDFWLMALINLGLWLGFYKAAALFFRNNPCLCLLPLIVAGVPLAALGLGCLLGMQPFQSRYLPPLSVCLALLSVGGLSGFAEETEDAERLSGLELMKKVPKLAAVPAVIVLAVNLAVSLLLPFAGGFWYQNWTPAIEFVNKNKVSDQDIVLNYIPYTLFGFAGNYAIDKIHYRIGENGESDSFSIDEDYRGLQLVPLSAAVLTDDFFKANGDKTLFLVMNQAEALGREIGFIMNALDARYVIDEEMHVKGVGFQKIDVYRLRPKKNTPAQ